MKSASAQSPVLSPESSDPVGQPAYLIRADFPNQPSKKIRLPREIPELLRVATKALDLKRPAKQIFTYDGYSVGSVSDIEPESVLVVSCADPDTSVEAPPYKRRTRKGRPPYLPLVKVPKERPRWEDDVEHQAIAASPSTVKDNMRDALLSLYASLTPKHREHLPCSVALEKMTSDARMFAVENSLLSQFIGPTSVITDSDLFDQTNSWMLDRLKGVRAEECRFAITGPPQSGKSTLLFIATFLFYQKLELSDQNANYLIFPINWRIQQIHAVEVVRLYALFVRTVLHMVRGSRLEYIPVLGPLQHWFLSLVTLRAFPPLPQSVLRLSVFPHESVLQIGADIHRAWNNKAGLADFVELAVSLPARLAGAFGYKSLVPVFDHFDACGFLIDPPENFPLSVKPVDLSAVICRTYQNCPFFVASQDDGDFLSLFAMANFRQLTTERLIAKPTEKQILIPELKIALNSGLCHGCPGYCAMYQRLCELVIEATEQVAMKSQYQSLRSVVDIARKDLVKQELLRVSLLFAAIDAEGMVDPEKMNRLSSLDDIDIRVL
jgi:hypothetical protein